jgi:predicted nucleic acid-binding protein
MADQVLLELWNGARDEHDAQVVRQLEQEIDRLETTPEVWAEARRLAWRCRQAGVTVPSSDLLIAACARVHEVELLHRDAHFDRIAAVAGKGR